MAARFLNALSTISMVAQTPSAPLPNRVSGLMAKAAKGDGEAAESLGEIYEDGEDVSKDPSLAYAWFVKAAALGSRGGQERAGWHELEGVGTPADSTKALESFRKATASGSGYAASEIGYMYKHGRGVPQNDEMAVQWFQRAVQQGYLKACGQLGWLTENGLGTPKDASEAARLYYLGANDGDDVSQDNLGWLCVEGRGVTGKNYGLAMKLFQQSAAQGNARAEGNIGYLYEHGFGVAKDSRQAAQWFERSADHGDLESQIHITGLILAGGLGKPDFARCLHYSTLAAQQGSDAGYANLTFAIQFLSDPSSSEANKAFQVLKTGASEGNPQAFVPLGICYLKGIGTTADASQAKQWLLRAAQDARASKMILPSCRKLATGAAGYPKDVGLAIELLHAAAQAGNPQAPVEIARLDPDPVRSLADLERLSTDGNAAASYELGLRYQNGDHAPANAKKALSLFQASASKGFAEAMYHLGVLYEAGILVKADKGNAAAWYVKAKAAGHPLAAARITPDGQLKPMDSPLTVIASPATGSPGK